MGGVAWVAGTVGLGRVRADWAGWAEDLGTAVWAGWGAAAKGVQVAAAGTHLSSTA